MHHNNLSHLQIKYHCIYAFCLPIETDFFNLDEDCEIMHQDLKTEVLCNVVIGLSN